MFKKYGKLLFPAVLAVMAVFSSGCRMVPGESAAAVPVIRVLEVPALSEIDSVDLNIAGPGMDPVSVTYTSLPDKINISVPEGSHRTFTLDINMNPDYVWAIKSFRGTGTADISPDIAEVVINIMGIGNTEIIVPDTENRRLVQLYDITGKGWTTLEESQILSGSINFTPVDVDFDSDGVFYVANNDTGGAGGVYKFFSITYTEPVALISSGSSSGTTAVAVDRVNNRVYAVYDNAVYYTSIDSEPGGSGTLFINVPSSEIIYGIAVDDKSNVYVCGDDGNGAPWLVKYDSSGANTAQDSYMPGESYTLNDVVYYNNSVIVSSNNTETGGAQILRFDPSDVSAGPSDSYGLLNSGSNSNASGDFGGPHTFLATMNDHLTLIDYDSGGSVSRIVSFDDMTGSGWAVYGTYGTGKGQFRFTSAPY